MEYCSGGSVADLIAVEGEPLREDIIAFICSEALKVSSRGGGALARQRGGQHGGPSYARQSIEGGQEGPCGKE